jgi:RNA-directed DNA polymerase
MRITDRSVLALIRSWLEAPIVETDEQGRKTAHRPTQGSPQGGVISPLLANVYLHWFEHLFHRPNGPGVWAKAHLVRYAGMTSSSWPNTRENACKPGWKRRCKVASS